MYTLNFQLCLGSFDSEPPHCKILLFFKTFSNKRTIHHLSGEPGSNPHSRTAGVFWNTCTESLRKNSWAETQSSGGGRDQTTESSTGKATRICVCVRLRTPDKFVQGSIWFVDTAFLPHYPAGFLALGNR